MVTVVRGVGGFLCMALLFFRRGVVIICGLRVTLA